MVLTQNDMLKIVFDVIRENPGDKVPITIMEKTCEKIIEKKKQNKDNNKKIDTQEICDDVCDTISYYNDFIREKNIPLQTISGEYYNMVVIAINAIIGEIK